MAEDTKPDKPDSGPGSGEPPPEPPAGQGAGQGKDEPFPPEMQALMTRKRQEDRAELARYKNELRDQIEEELTRRHDVPEPPERPDIVEGVELDAVDKLVRQVPGFKALGEKIAHLEALVQRNALAGGLDALEGRPYMDEVRDEIECTLKGAPQIDRRTVEAAYRFHAEPKLAARVVELEAEQKRLDDEHRARLEAAGVSDTGGTTSGSAELDPATMTTKELEKQLEGMSEVEKMAAMGFVTGK